MKAVYWAESLVKLMAAWKVRNKAVMMVD